VPRRWNWDPNFCTLHAEIGQERICALDLATLVLEYWQRRVGR
jgi:hypothetical protein